VGDKERGRNGMSLRQQAKLILVRSDLELDTYAFICGSKHYLDRRSKENMQNTFLLTVLA
jgi:hypothetical protein